MMRITGDSALESPLGSPALGRSGPLGVAAAAHLCALLEATGDSFQLGGQVAGFTPKPAPPPLGPEGLALLVGLRHVLQQLHQSEAPGRSCEPPAQGAGRGQEFGPAELAWLMVAVLGNLMAQQGGGACRCVGALPTQSWGQSRPAPAWGGGGAPGFEGAPAKRAPGVGGSSGAGTSGAFLDAALAQNGDRYVYGAETNLSDADPDTFDCSELVQWAAAQAGVSIPDGSSNQRAACIPISVDEAMRTPGALLFRDGHVAISLGDGRTIEAKGSRYGVGVFSASGRFTSGGLIPGMSYS